MSDLELTLLTKTKRVSLLGSVACCSLQTANCLSESKKLRSLQQKSFASIFFFFNFWKNALQFFNGKWLLHFSYEYSPVKKDPKLFVRKQVKIFV